MPRFTHIGQYWSRDRRQVRLLGARDVRMGPEGMLSGVGYDLSPEALSLPCWRQRMGVVGTGRDWRSVAGACAHLPWPVTELVASVEARGERMVEWAARGVGDDVVERELPLRALDRPPDPDCDHLVAPVIPPRALAFGVTYLNSALERETEGRRGDYGYVYRAVKERGERPELFLKGTSPEHFVGPGGVMGARRDLTNSRDLSGEERPRIATGCGIEPELAVVVHSDGGIWGYTLANDVSANRLENETLLYLTQAKYFTGCLVLGPLILVSTTPDNPGLEITTRIRDARGELLFERRSDTSRINAPLHDLVAWAGSHLRLAPGEVLSTGTDVVPDGPVKVLEPGMTVEISCPSIGCLRHGVAEIPASGDLNLDYGRLEHEGASSHGA